MLSIFPLFAIPSVCPHSWRRLTSDDYGSFGRHWAGYHGVTEDECRWCGTMRETPREVIEEEKAVKNGSLPPSIRALKPWKRGSYGFGMKPNNSMNSTGTFCSKCGDWITDSAYNSEHGIGRCPRPGSWNYENPRYKRKSDEDFEPGHEEWLEEMKEWAQKNKGHTFSSGSWPASSYIGNHDRLFHSFEEARSILEPCGLSLSDDTCGIKGDYITRRRAGVMADYGSGPVKDKLTKKEIAHANKVNAAYIKKHGKLNKLAAAS